MIDENGNICTEFNGKHVHPSEVGWSKTITLSGIFGTETFYDLQRGSKTKLKSRKAFCYRTYKVSVKPCRYCQELLENGTINESGCFIKVQSIFNLVRRCWISKYGIHANSDMTEIFMAWDSKDWKLISEKAIETEKEILDLYKAGKIQIVTDLGIIHMLENRMGIKC